MSSFMAKNSTTWFRCGSRWPEWDTSKFRSSCPSCVLWGKSQIVLLRYCSPLSSGVLRGPNGRGGFRKHNTHSVYIHQPLSICRSLTRKEKLIQGLSGQKQSPRLQVVHLGPPKGRGVITKDEIMAGEFMCEYKTYRVYPVGSELHKELEQEYQKNGEGSFTVQTAYPIPDVGRLCFDATRRYRDVGRLINHSPHPNLSISQPIHLRGKWRLGLMAIRDIAPDTEITFDYGVREMKWMRSRQDQMSPAVSLREPSSPPSPTSPSQDVVVTAGPAAKGMRGHKGKGRAAALTPAKRNHFWCPVVDCASGPIQKLGQHLSKVHKLDAQAVAKLLKKKTRAHPEAIKLKLPNPNKRRSGIQFFPLFVAKNTTTTETPIPKPKDAKASSGGFHSGGGPSWRDFWPTCRHMLGATEGKTRRPSSLGASGSTSTPSTLTSSRMNVCWTSTPSRGIWRTSNGSQGWEHVGYSIGCLPTWRLSSL